LFLRFDAKPKARFLPRFLHSLVSKANGGMFFLDKALFGRILFVLQELHLSLGKISCKAKN